MAYFFYVIRTVFQYLSHLKRCFGKAPEYIFFTLNGEYPPLPPPREGLIKNLFSRPVPSMKELQGQLKQVGKDPRVKGVVLRLYQVPHSPASLQTLLNSLLLLKKQGKQVITWAPSYTQASYMVALAAHEILIQEGGEIASLGLKKRFLFLAQALKKWGIQMDLIPISPYKSAGDRLTRCEMSPEVRDMENWILESSYQEHLQALMDGRGFKEEKAREIMDESPYTDRKAQDLQLVDKIISQEDLPAYLKTKQLVSWTRASKKIKKRPLPPPGKGVALIRVEGMIVDGESKRPPLNTPLPIPLLLEPRAGDLTVVQEVRQALQEKRCKAVVLYIDSGGGSAPASEAMAAALTKLAAQKPLVVSMGSVAASGGYYIATPAHHILAHPQTITGSIGVLGGKMVDEGLMEKLLFHRDIITRGESALFNDSSRPYTQAERKKVEERIKRTYQIFLERVAQARKMTREEVDSISGGRVWTGRQAQERGLVDMLGDLDQALIKARQLAHLHPEAPVWEIRSGKEKLPPKGEASALIEYLLEGFRLYREGGVFYQLPFSFRRE